MNGASGLADIDGRNIRHLFCLTDLRDFAASREIYGIGRTRRREDTKKCGTMKAMDVLSALAGPRVDSCHLCLAPDVRISPKEFGCMGRSVLRDFVPS